MDSKDGDVIKDQVVGGAVVSHPHNQESLQQGRTDRRSVTQSLLAAPIARERNKKTKQNPEQKQKQEQLFQIQKLPLPAGVQSLDQRVSVC